MLAAGCAYRQVEGSMMQHCAWYARSVHVWEVVQLMSRDTGFCGYFAWWRPRWRHNISAQHGSVDLRICGSRMAATQHGGFMAVQHGLMRNDTVEC